jgi:hypothetical protein
MNSDPILAHSGLRQFNTLCWLLLALYRLPPPPSVLNKG